MGNLTGSKKDENEGHISNNTNLVKTIKDGKKQKMELTGQDFALTLPNDLLLPGVTYFGVYDGHGSKGKEAADSLKNEISNTLKKDKLILKKLKSRNEVFDYFKNLFYKLNQIFEKKHNDFLISGSCAISILIVETKLYAINVGDSRAILGSKKNDKKIALELSVDHKPDRPSETKRVIESGGEVKFKLGNPPRVFRKNDEYPGLAVSRTIGDILGHECGVSSEPEVIERELEPEDSFVVIGSDGVWDLMNSCEVVGYIFHLMEENVSNEKICARLVEECRNRWELINLLKQKYSSELTLLKDKNKKKSVGQEINIDDISAVIYFIKLKTDDI